MYREHQSAAMKERTTSAISKSEIMKNSTPSNQKLRMPVTIAMTTLAPMTIMARNTRAL